MPKYTRKRKLLHAIIAMLAMGVSHKTLNKHGMQLIKNAKQHLNPIVANYKEEVIKQLHLKGNNGQYVIPNPVLARVYQSLNNKNSVFYQYYSNNTAKTLKNSILKELINNRKANHPKNYKGNKATKQNVNNLMKSVSQVVIQEYSSQPKTRLNGNNMVPIIINKLSNTTVGSVKNYNNQTLAAMWKSLNNNATILGIKFTPTNINNIKTTIVTILNTRKANHPSKISTKIGDRHNVNRAWYSILSNGNKNMSSRAESININKRTENTAKKSTGVKMAQEGIEKQLLSTIEFALVNLTSKSGIYWNKFTNKEKKFLKAYKDKMTLPYNKNTNNKVLNLYNNNPEIAHIFTTYVGDKLAKNEFIYPCMH